MVRKKHRDNFQIMCDVLNAAVDESKISQIGRRAGLSYYAGMDMIEKLASLGLLEIEEKQFHRTEMSEKLSKRFNKKNPEVYKFYKTTMKGKEFVKMHEELVGMLRI